MLGNINVVNCMVGGVICQTPVIEAASHLSRWEGPKDFGEGRTCSVCGHSLSRSNPGPRCRCCERSIINPRPHYRGPVPFTWADD